jgi:hypothetical protein
LNPHRLNQLTPNRMMKVLLRTRLWKIRKNNSFGLVLLPIHYFKKE